MAESFGYSKGSSGHCFKNGYALDSTAIANVIPDEYAAGIRKCDVFTNPGRSSRLLSWTIFATCPRTKSWFRFTI